MVVRQLSDNSAPVDKNMAHAIPGSDLRRILQRSFDDAIESSTASHFSNALKSSKLVSNLGHYLYHALNNTQLTLNVVTVDNEGNKSPGEWLLDVAITQNDGNGFRQRIVWAVESETDTAWKAFYDDFAKLMHVRSANYLYLNGLNHRTVPGMEKYVHQRLEIAQRILRRSRIQNLYFGFCASPCKPDKYTESIWDVIASTVFEHIKTVRLYYYTNGVFTPVP